MQWNAGGAAITLGYASATTEATSQDTDSTVMGVKVASGNITAAVSQSTFESAAVAAKDGVACNYILLRVAQSMRWIKQTKSL